MSKAERYRAAHRAAFDRVAAAGGSLPLGGQRQLAQDLGKEFDVDISQATVSRASHGAAAGANYKPSNRCGPLSKITEQIQADIAFIVRTLAVNWVVPLQ